MPRVPTKVSIICQSCKTQFNPRQFTRAGGNCTKCGASTWQLHADFSVADASGDPTSAPEITAAGVGLNLLGISLMAATGTGFTVSPGLGGLSAGNQRNSGTSVYDSYDIPKAQLLPFCQPPAELEKLGVFIDTKERELHRNRMKQRGGNHCKHCDILFVPSAEKPWTLVGTCSKQCCAEVHSVSDYSQIESQVVEATRDTAKFLEKSKVDSQRVRIRCKCGTEIEFPSMYKGTYRKCNRCQERILVPLN